MRPEVSGYELGALLGEGGFSQVWQAHATSGADVAIKVAYASTSVARIRFAREAEALASIGPPHVPAIYRHGVLDDGRPYLVMEHLRDSNLATLLEARHDPPDVAWIRDVGDAVLASLAAVHSRQLVHRDLKPENIFLSPSPFHARLTDFGIALRELTGGEASDSSQRAILGTAEYMAPEQIAGRPDLDTRADIYAFGVLIYEFLTLRVPFTGDLASVEKGHTSLRPPRPSEFVTVPQALEELCLECLAKDATRRPPDANTLRRRLAAACRDAGDRPIVVRSDASVPIKLLSVTLHPVVLLAAEVTSLERAVTDAVTRRKGFLARQQGLRLISAFSGVLVEKPEQVALAAAQELVEQHEARVVLHFAELTLRPSAGQRAPKLYGAAVQDPASWLPRAGWRGLLLTPAMADLLPEGRTEPSASHPGFRELRLAQLAAEAEDLPLFGRDEVIGSAIEDIHASLDSACPGLFSLIGEHGLGKSRLARHLATLVRRDYPEVQVVRLQASRRSAGRGGELHHEIVRILSGRELPMAEADELTSRPITGLGHELRQYARAAPLVLIIDDAHYVDDLTLDAIEYATVHGEGISLWIAVCAHPRLERRRPQWGRRAHRHTPLHLDPLDERAAMDMASALLRPAEFPPRAVLAKLAQWTAGNPQVLEQLVRALKKRGIVRQRVYSNSWYVATAELDQLPASPVSQWLAARQLDGLPPEQAACVRVCAVLGPEFTRDELAWVQSAAERDHTATTSIDTDVGITALAEQGIITRVRGELWAFHKASFQDAIYKLVSRRDREHIHRSALAFWEAQAMDVVDVEHAFARIARHASACGAQDTAADAHLGLGDRARAEHRYVEADLHYSAALSSTRSDDHARLAHALGGMGRVRYRMQRIQESIEDLRRAATHAVALGDRTLTAELLLEEAIALDWAARYTESAHRVEEAHALLDPGVDTRLAARFLMSDGRSHYRAGRTGAATTQLTRAVELADATGDVETHIIALLLLAVMLTFSGRIDESQRHFANAIELCERTRDRLHLCVAYNNRASLWSAGHSLANLRADLGRSIQLAREMGQPVIERGAAHNLAEVLYWTGHYHDALALARRAYDLTRFLPERIAADALLIARILTAMGRGDEACAMVDEARHLSQSGEPAVSDELVIRMLDLALAGATSASSPEWDELVSLTRESLPGEEFLEVLYFRGRVAKAAGQWSMLADVLAAARDRLEEYPVWKAPFQALTPQRPGT